MLKQQTTDIPFSVEALKATLQRLESEYWAYQDKRDREAVFGYLSAVFETVAWWSHERKAKKYAQQALGLQRPPVPKIADPFFLETSLYG